MGSAVVHRARFTRGTDWDLLCRSRESLQSFWYTGLDGYVSCKNCLRIMRVRDADAPRKRKEQPS